MKRKVNHDPGESSAPKPAAGLIWARPERPRTVRPALSRERIVQVALSLADTEGIDAISTRRIAAALSVSAMALYGYIERKEDVFDLMIDAVYAEVPVPLPGPRDWRSQLQEIAVQKRAMMHRHPWFASLIGRRAVLGPNALKQTDYLLEIVSQPGFDMTTCISLLEMFNAYIVGFVLREMGEAEAQRRTGLSEQEWQQQVSPYVQKQIIASGRYPHLALALVEEERSSDETFLFGLTRLLEGIATYAAASHANHEREW
ncbi:TetR family transcriptional regulator [Reticulibacter mediterranei]|uniref:TetR family transcriptional regulator n=1 Tax=Reticulibacter mediterranei TaxID=2778369 RepID=A0A8J3ID45_9CHLR|nr:TetR/AcrR family transcriptional regulator [Reticulibacter mediterranei]GHO90328.1 TetR family transcriptional regulator [Reticulibacter mediterranei]